jgi:inner membrane protein
MPSIIAHPWPVLALIPALRRTGVPRRLWVLGALCAIAPDADVAAIPLGVPYGHVLAHRGLTHSLPFAAFLAGLLAIAAFRGPFRRLAFAYLFVATASHGVLDAATNGGIGVAFFAPFHDARYHLPFRPIEVSPIGVGRFFSERGARILANELLVVGVPSLLAAAAAQAMGRRRTEPLR